MLNFRMNTRHSRNDIFRSVALTSCVCMMVSFFFFFLLRKINQVVCVHVKIFLQSGDKRTSRLARGNTQIRISFSDRIISLKSNFPKCKMFAPSRWIRSYAVDWFYRFGCRCAENWCGNQLNVCKCMHENISWCWKGCTETCDWVERNEWMNKKNKTHNTTMKMNVIWKLTNLIAISQQTVIFYLHKWTRAKMNAHKMMLLLERI